MSHPVLKHASATAGVMIGFGVVCTVILAAIYLVTREPIAASERAARLRLFGEVLPAAEYDNALLEDVVHIPAGGVLGNRAETLAYRARHAGHPAAVILEAVAPDGYSGDIKLLIAIRANGTLAGVRVLAHKETPGLGDYIETAHGDWIRHFDGQSLERTPDAGWKVRKDNGQFDYMAGATITPRAVVGAVHRALGYFAAHREALWAGRAL